MGYSKAHELKMFSRKSYDTHFFKNVSSIVYSDLNFNEMPLEKFYKQIQILHLRLLHVLKTKSNCIYLLNQKHTKLASNT